MQVKGAVFVNGHRSADRVKVKRVVRGGDHASLVG